MKRAGFTMIELIFVIVILGILAAVAIPKLAATRDDANIAKAATDVATAIQDMGAYYTAQDQFGDVSDMTNVKLSGDGNLTTAPSYQVNGVDCVDFNTTAEALADGNISVSFPASGNALCTKVQAMLASKDINKTHSFGGQKVSW
ncbi:MAG: type II secretion system protein [Epsilonproteobacteria bacterium]|nr:type II secretion system protein [Campylobacterota bacterium]